LIEILNNTAQYHGGGWVFGNLTMDTEFCKRLVNELGCVVFDVDYRLAPENKYPIPIEDSWDAFNWVCIFVFFSIQAPLEELFMKARRVSIVILPEYAVHSRAMKLFKQNVST